MLEQQKFRSDLFYRLNVFPIRVPPLRDRSEDIPFLVQHFTQQFARRMKKRIETIPWDTINILCEYQWPGNIRELQNVVERAVILSYGPELRLEVSDFRKSGATKYGSSATPAQGNLQRVLQETERRWILRALKQTRWVVAGPHGAAAHLGVKRSTLQARMQKLGITRAHGTAGLADWESSNEVFV
jgi:formate hydrogenlyase transcriptional activator